jgi:hypothetical protein
MRFSELSAALLVAPLVAVHGAKPAMLKGRNILARQANPTVSTDGSCGGFTGLTCLGKSTTALHEFDVR